MLKKLAYSGLGLVLLASPLLASADQLSDLRVQLQSLISQLTTLQAQLGSGAVLGASTSCVALNNNLFPGDTDETKNGEVSKLQQFLLQDSSAAYTGSGTGYYGSLTVSAVQRYQSAHGIVSSGSPSTTGYGAVGPATRAAMANCGDSSSNASVSVSTPNNSSSLTLNDAQTSLIYPTHFQIDYKVGSEPRGPVYVVFKLVDMLTSEITPLGFSGATTPEGSYVAFLRTPVGGHDLTKGRRYVVRMALIGPYSYPENVDCQNQPCSAPTGPVVAVAESGMFTIVSPSTSVTPSVADFRTDKAEYQVGETVKFTAKVIDEPGSPFTPGEGAEVRIYQMNSSGSVNDIDTVQFNPLSQYYEHSANDHTGSADVGGWSAYVVVLKNGKQVAKSNTIAYSVVTSVQPKITVVSPNGGESIDPTKSFDISFAHSGIYSYSAALYKNDQFKYWIAQGNPVSGTSGVQALSWQTPASSLTGLGEGDSAGSIFKIYVSGKKLDGSGIVEDKSDAPFSFLGSNTVSCPTGYILQNGVCAPSTTSCPTGYILQGGSCVANVTTPAAPTCTISASSATPSTQTAFGGYYFVKPNSSATLTWQSTNATSATLNGMPAPTSGSQVFTGLTNNFNTYSVRVSGPGGSGKCEQIVFVDYKG